MHSSASGRLVAFEVMQEEAPDSLEEPPYLTEGVNYQQIASQQRASQQMISQQIAPHQIPPQQLQQLRVAQPNSKRRDSAIQEVQERRNIE